MALDQVLFRQREGSCSLQLTGIIQCKAGAIHKLLKMETNHPLSCAKNRKDKGLAAGRVRWETENCPGTTGSTPYKASSGLLLRYRIDRTVAVTDITLERCGLSCIDSTGWLRLSQATFLTNRLLSAAGLGRAETNLVCSSARNLDFAPESFDSIAGNLDMQKDGAPEEARPSHEIWTVPSTSLRVSPSSYENEHDDRFDPDGAE